MVAETDVLLLKISRYNFESYGLADKIEFPAPQQALKQHAIFVDAIAMKQRIRDQMMRPPYDVRNYYKTNGFCQKVARSNVFENFTLAIIAVNAIWIAVDTDHNDSDVLVEA